MRDAPNPQAEVAARFLAEGVRLPLRISDHDARVIVDATGEPIAMALPSLSRPTQARRAALLAMLPNVAAGVSDADPQPLAAE